MNHFLYLLSFVFIAIAFLMVGAGWLLVRFGFFPGVKSLWPARHKSIDLTQVASPVADLSTPLWSKYIELMRTDSQNYSQKNFASRITASSIYERHTDRNSNGMTISSCSSHPPNIKYNTSAEIHHRDVAMGCS